METSFYVLSLTAKIMILQFRFLGFCPVHFVLFPFCDCLTLLKFLYFFLTLCKAILFLKVP